MDESIVTDNQVSTSITQVLNQIADAVQLQEGEAGVRSVFHAFHRNGPCSTKQVSRLVSLPVPLVAAVSSELRQHGWLTEERPSRLTAQGDAVAKELGSAFTHDPTCTTCQGREVTIPSGLETAIETLTEIMANGPTADLTLDQSHCTAETKIRRILTLIRAGALPGGPLLLIGDDDLVSLAIGVVGELLGVRLVNRLAVADVSEAVLGFIAETAPGVGIEVEPVQHDLRWPLPDTIRGQFDVAMTDPPYTPEGAKLFLSRAVEGLRPGPARSIFFSFGPKGTDESLAVQREILDLGLVTHRLMPNFNEYAGSGILAGTGSMHQLLTTKATSSAAADTYQGPLYTRDKRTRQREYACVSCGAMHAVGPGAQWSGITELQATGCLECGAGPFRPGRLLEQKSSATDVESV